MYNYQQFDIVNVIKKIVHMNLTENVNSAATL